MIIALASVGDARAQISPGPLSEAHQSLEGMGNCLQCHELGERETTTLCLDCHGEIGRLREAGRGLHAREGSGDCASCHPEHGGRDFDVVGFEGGPGGFDHGRAGWPLDGAHATVACESCHRERFLDPPIVVGRPEGAGPSRWVGLANDCASCHADPHQGRFGAECRDCHGTRDFRVVETTSFDHGRTDYPLRGAHREVACDRCHKESITAPLEFSRCTSCHDDPHRGLATLAGASVDCEACHTVGGFRPSTFGTARHSSCAFPLEGRHVAVDCDACHRRDGAASFDFRPPAARCADCHADAHRGELGEAGSRCETCHTVSGFAPSTFSAADHGRAGFPLEGAHGLAECRACHGPTPVTFAFAATTCVSCHADPHRGRLGAVDADCRRCHSLDGFHPVTMDAAAHARSGFALDGAHAAVPCFECHRAMLDARPASTVPASASWPDLSFQESGRCVDCHADPHAGQFRAGDELRDCAACHDVHVFTPASRFDHESQTRFPLRGAHERVACGACHAPATEGEAVRYAGTPMECVACHTVTPGGER